MFGEGGPAFATGVDSARPREGDRLVAEDSEGKPKALQLLDIKIGDKPFGAFPFNPADGIKREGSRLNRIILVRFDSSELTPDQLARSADGVFAFSGVCPHRGCDVTEWNDKDRMILCYCHLSQFDPRNQGAVFAGPAPRPLPILPLKSEQSEIVIAGEFSSEPGGAKAID
ncbi:Rieske (2Fe-2S) protein [Rhodoblastus sp. 17X3]|uniref:QcrA and Rieske domain-containing protein n=1 Tax=Rhodoblastus sp. 17X3 TaxID=3047026 RepID=UPI0024B756B0|nr:Rieske (2Fe-2S) protein [Rhodoblastus sp. 17X3]MDI9849017.1 Rieske (2Fe-2S) protein [Rhodoblastus sp. 17X3]